MLEQEKKQADLEISRKELEFHQQEKMIQQLEQRLTEERKRKRRAARKVRVVYVVRGDVAVWCLWWLTVVGWFGGVVTIGCLEGGWLLGA